jgi:hypothetical protein
MSASKRSKMEQSINLNSIYENEHNYHDAAGRTNDKNIMAECYELILDLINQLKIKSNPTSYILSGNFIKRTLYCYRFYESVKDLTLVIIIKIKSNNEKIIKEISRKPNIIILEGPNYIYINYKDIRLITVFIDPKYISLNNTNIYNHEVELLNEYDQDNDFCYDLRLDLHEKLNDNSVLFLYRKYSIKNFNTINKSNLPIIRREILDRKLDSIQNIRYLWDYTRHSNTLNINLLKIHNGKNEYDYPIYKEKMQEDENNVIYQDRDFIQKYPQAKIEYLYNGDKISVIKEKLMKVMDEIIKNTGYDYSHGFFCYRFTNYVYPYKINNIIEIEHNINSEKEEDKKHKTINIPYFMSCFSTLENIKLDWLLSFRSVLLVIYVDGGIKKYISIDPCEETVECFFGSENELLFMPNCQLKMLMFKKEIFNHKGMNFFINVILCKLEYNEPKTLLQAPAPAPAPAAAAAAVPLVGGFSLLKIYEQIRNDI